MTPEQELDVRRALIAYWTSRADAKTQQTVRGTQDVGERAGVTSGAHLDRVAQLLGKICMAAGAPPEVVYYNAPADDPHKRENSSDGYTLPGYYRPTKQWDVVVYKDGLPIVVIELKSQNGPSYSNNANNRAEEAIGNAVDLARARANGLGGDIWTGYVYVIEDDEVSVRAGGERDRGFIDRDQAFDNWSYVERVGLLCKRLVEDRLYDASWAVATSRPTCPATAKKPDRCAKIKTNVVQFGEEHTHQFDWREPDVDLLGYVQFTKKLSAHIAKHYGVGGKRGSSSLTISD